jgi:hypothetical protein
MSFHRPQDRNRDHKEQINQQYHDARDKMSHTDVNAHLDVGHDGEEKRETEEERKKRLAQDIASRLDQTGKQVRRDHDRGTAGS